MSADVAGVADRDDVRERDLPALGDRHKVMDLERLKRGARIEIRPIRATPLPHAAAEGA